MIFEQYIIVGLGEVLWDLLPGGRQLGGAPANFAYISTALGNRAFIASRVGTDTQGREALEHLQKLGLPALHVQLDEKHATGTVRVWVDEKGQPDFAIAEDVAWDYLEWTSAWTELAAQADAVCFGSLAQREPQSRETIRRFLQSTRRDCLRVFDVNLRKRHYSAGVLVESLSAASILKLNHEELPVITKMLDMPGDDEVDQSRSLIDAFDLQLVCVTRGGRGSLLVTGSEVDEHGGFQVEVVDTVGAGDAFTATLIHHYLRKAPLSKINEAANRMGALVASHSGATPLLSPDALRQIV